MPDVKESFKEKDDVRGINSENYDSNTVTALLRPSVSEIGVSASVAKVDPCPTNLPKLSEMQASGPLDKSSQIELEVGWIPPVACTKTWDSPIKKPKPDEKVGEGVMREGSSYMQTSFNRQDQDPASKDDLEIPATLMAPSEEAHEDVDKKEEGPAVSESKYDGERRHRFSKPGEDDRKGYVDFK